MNQEALNQKIMAAHDMNDTTTLGILYLKAGKFFIANGDIDHGCFLLTAAYVFSLEAGITQAMEAKEVLINHGREE
jgi:hypothetical protein